MSFGVIILVGILMAMPRQTLAASPWIETFSGSLGGWTNTGSPAWRSTNDYAQVTFSASPTPQTSTLIATGTLASAAFTGDYTAAGMTLLGFKFRAEQVLPSGLTLRWMRTTNGYFRNLQTAVLATGIWYQFHFSLQDKETGGWDGDPGDLFTQVLAGVDTVALAVTKPATLAASSFRIDDVVIDRLPAATHVAALSATTTLLRWDYLQTNVSYQLEYAEAPTSDWAAVQSWLATNRQHDLSATGLPDWLFWRLRMP
jgi:hypothetical protein